jgi:hypothetical protein
MALKARINTARQIPLFYTAALLDTPRVKIYDADATLLDTILLTSSSTLANLYLSDEDYTFTAVGTYTLKFEHLVATVYTVVFTDTLIVGLDPTTDVELSDTTGPTLILDDAVVGDITSTVTCDVLDDTDTVVETVAATYSAATSGYEADLSPIDSEGSYYIVWYDDGVFEHYQELLGLVPKEYELVSMEVFYTTGSAAIPHVGTTVLFLRTSDEEPIAQDVTDSSGFVSVVIPPDEYYVILSKSGVVYSRNNVEIVVVDTTTKVGNDFQYESDYLTPTFFPLASAVDTATLYANLYNFDGTPMGDTDILISLEQGPGNFSNNVVFGHSVVVKTNKSGYVTFDLVQGITVTVTIMSHSLRRTIVVPSVVGPTDIMTLLATAEDVFDIVTVDIPATPRRSL